MSRLTGKQERVMHTIRLLGRMSDSGWVRVRQVIDAVGGAPSSLYLVLYRLESKGFINSKMVGNSKCVIDCERAAQVDDVLNPDDGAEPAAPRKAPGVKLSAQGIDALYNGRRYQDVRLKPSGREPVYVPRRGGNEGRITGSSAMFAMLAEVGETRKFSATPAKRGKRAEETSHAV